MKKVCSEDKCTGCHACLNICPRKCISMPYDDNEMLMPSIDQDNCIDCGACQKVCPVNSPVEKRECNHAYAAWHKDFSIRKKSASGGAAMALYETVIEEGGICYGTKFDQNLLLHMQSADSVKGVHAFRTSKYAQASVGKTFQEVKENLIQGKKVLYIGTPCQIAGLKNYLNKNYENLLTVDLICHGVSSHVFLMEHVSAIENTIKKKIDNITFRGEFDYQLGLYEGGELVYLKDRYLDSYFTGFMTGLINRSSCYSCPYACGERVGDITIGDFWGLGQEVPCTYGHGHGVSVLLPTTDKGYAYIEKLKTRMFVDERPVSEAIRGNSQLMHPCEKHPKYDMFWNLYPKVGFEKAVNTCTKEEIEMYHKHMKYSFVKVIKGRCKVALKKGFKKIQKRCGSIMAS